MTILEALGFFLQPENIPPEPCPSAFSIDGEPEDLPDSCNWALYHTILASLSGAMEDASSAEDLQEAVEHGGSLCGAGLVQHEDLERELQAALDALAEWGNITAGAGGIRACGPTVSQGGASPAGNPATSSSTGSTSSTPSTPTTPPRRIRPARARGPG